MRDVLISLLAGLTATLRTRGSLQFEILALRHQLSVLQRHGRRFPFRGVPGELVIRGSTQSDSRFCYDEKMRNLIILFTHVIATYARLLGPGGIRSVVAESVLLKQQL